MQMEKSVKYNRRLFFTTNDKNLIKNVSGVWCRIYFIVTSHWLQAAKEALAQVGSFFETAMASESEAHLSSDGDSSNNISDNETYYNYNTVYEPYEDEPLADSDDSNKIDGEENSEKHDMDGLAPSTLEARYEKSVTVDSW